MRRGPKVALLALLASTHALIVLAGRGERTVPEATGAEEIVERYVQASGGAALAAVVSETRTGTLIRGNAGKVPFEIHASAPGKWRWLQTFAWGDRVAFGCDGTEAWVQDGRGIEAMSPEQRVDLELLLDPQAPLRLHELFPVMTVSRTEKVGHAEVVTVAATSREGVHTELAFERDSGLLIRAGSMLLQDYRTVGTVKRPFRFVLGSDQGEAHLATTMQVSDTRQNVDLDGDLFSRPSCPLSPSEAPLYKPRKEVEVSTAALDACVGVYQHPTNPGVTFTVAREGTHLMLQRSSGSRIEIKPASDTDYFIRFLGIDVHFVKNDAGEVTHLEIAGDRPIRAEKVQ